MSKLLLSMFLIIPLSAQTDYSPALSKIELLLKDEFFIRSGISISVYDLTENRTVFEKDVKKLLRPASNMKILTSAAGLLFLGEEYKFRTSVLYTGSIVNSVLLGDLYIKGGCDPDFTTPDLDSILTSLEKAGIREISGKIYIDLSMKDELFWGKGWMWDDDPSTDAPYLSALNINDNSLTVKVFSGKLYTPAVILTEPVTGYVKIINQSMTTTAALSSISISRNWTNRSNDIVVNGSISSFDSVQTVSLNLFSPENYFVQLLFERFSKNGLKIKESAYFSGTPDKAIHLYTLERNLDTVLINLNKVSDNLSAEMVLLALSDKAGLKPASASGGSRLIDSLIKLAGNNPSEYVIADGSGVSHYNLLSTELLNNVLKYFYYDQQFLYKKLYNSFPSAGRDGTLVNRMRGTSAENNVHAKTGTLSGVSSLSGYLTTKRGNDLSFSIFIQNFGGSAALARYYQDLICMILAES